MESAKEKHTKYVSEESSVSFSTSEASSTTCEHQLEEGEKQPSHVDKAPTDTRRDTTENGISIEGEKACLRREDGILVHITKKPGAANCHDPLKEPLVSISRRIGTKSRADETSRTR